MVRPSWSALAAGVLFGAAMAQSAADAAAGAPVENVVLEGAVMLECESSQACDAIEKVVVEKGARVRRSFKSDILNGLSLQLPQDPNKKDAVDVLLAEAKGITNKHAVHQTKLVLPTKPPTTPEGGANQPAGKKPEKSAEASDGQKETPAIVRRGLSQLTGRWNHIMSQVDKLHKEGITGQGINIAVIDTGVSFLLFFFSFSVTP